MVRSVVRNPIREKEGFLRGLAGRPPLKKYSLNFCYLAGYANGKCLKEELDRYIANGWRL